MQFIQDSQAESPLDEAQQKALMMHLKALLAQGLIYLQRNSKPLKPSAKNSHSSRLNFLTTSLMLPMIGRY